MTQVVCPSACTVTLEWSVPVLNVTTEEAGQIAGAILLVWAVGYSFRLLIRVLRDTDEIRDGE